MRSHLVPIEVLDFPHIRRRLKIDNSRDSEGLEQLIDFARASGKSPDVQVQKNLGTIHTLSPSLLGAVYDRPGARRAPLQKN